MTDLNGSPPVGAGPGAVVLCGACGRLRRCRLGLRTETLGPDGVVTTELVCGEDAEGGPGVAHGGWTAGALDELVGHVPLLAGQLAVTGELTVRFLRPVPVGRPLVARAWRQRHEGSRWFVRAELTLAATGADLAYADAILVERDRGHFDRHRAWLTEQDEHTARCAAAPASTAHPQPHRHDDKQQDEEQPCPAPRSVTSRASTAAASPTASPPSTATTG